MSHVRQQIREAIGTACTSLTTTAARVFQARVYPLATADLPGLAIYTNAETSEEAEVGGAARLLMRMLEVKIDGYSRRTSGLDDELDTICAEVEVAIMDNSTVQELVGNIYLSETSISFANEGDRPIGCASMTWNCVYLTEANDPQTSKS
jgi:hypothetical protein